MFTGIIKSMGRVVRRETCGPDVRLRIEYLGAPLAFTLGDSIGVNGVCLTVTAFNGTGFAVDVSAQTLACTTLGGWSTNTQVNLEPALTLATPLGGHLVSGHVDGIAELVRRKPQGQSVIMRFRIAAHLARYVAVKGSVCLDGVSLTVNTVEETEFEVNLIPHTLEHTTLGAWENGQTINFEVDLLARYLERLMGMDSKHPPAAGITREFLAHHGFNLDGH